MSESSEEKAKQEQDKYRFSGIKPGEPHPPIPLPRDPNTPNTTRQMVGDAVLSSLAPATTVNDLQWDEKTRTLSGTAKDRDEFFRKCEEFFRGKNFWDYCNSKKLSADGAMITYKWFPPTK